MSGFDEGAIYYNDQGYDLGASGDPGISRHAARAKFYNILEKKQLNSRGDSRTIGDALDRHSNQLRIDLQDIVEFDLDMGQCLETNPSEYLPLLEEAATLLQRKRLTADGEENFDEIPKLQVLLNSSRAFGPSSIRELTSEHVSKLVMVPGIVTAAYNPKHKATHITLMCRECRNTRIMACRPGLGGALIPRYCDACRQGAVATKPTQDPFVILPAKSKFVDQQQLKLQERPEDVPMGDLPRSMSVLMDRTLVATVSPGTRVTVVAIYSVTQGGGNKKDKKDRLGSVAVRQPYLHVVGLMEEVEGAHSMPTFTVEEEGEFRDFAAQPNVTQQIFERMAPNIFGHDDIKKAVACLLFGGARKRLPDGTWRRGDINVLLLGDPSTAKSQFLKFASKTAPIAVYTSGKGSSAAGLTASVIRDANGDFYLEGGAMVLADNGVVCIDEFDKMRPEDRVAIHEAMEQQTISIAKAGITTMLKSRTSVLAAANPPSGRYDELKDLSENIELQTTILSRFDLIFLVKDERNSNRDMQIAKHVLDVHRLAGMVNAEEDEETRREEQFLRRYIEYCRSRVSPRLSDSAAQTLASEYVDLREEVRQVAAGRSQDLPAVPITVRQLEAIIRISESLARMALHVTATEGHVRQAIDLFKTSTMDAVKAGVQDVVFSEEQRAELHATEAQIKRRVPIGGVVRARRLTEELVRCGMSPLLISRALHYLDQQGDFQYVRNRHFISRVR